MSIADELLKFKDLLDMGAITQEEFDTKKEELLNNSVNCNIATNEVVAYEDSTSKMTYIEEDEKVDSETPIHMFSSWIYLNIDNKLKNVSKTAIKNMMTSLGKKTTFFSTISVFNDKIEIDIEMKDAYKNYSVNYQDIQYTVDDVKYMMFYKIRFVNLQVNGDIISIPAFTDTIGNVLTSAGNDALKQQTYATKNNLDALVSALESSGSVKV